MSIDKNELLEKAKELLKEEVTSISFETWIKPLKIDSIKNNHIVFIANSEFQKDFIENKYTPLIWLISTKFLSAILLLSPLV